MNNNGVKVGVACVLLDRDNNVWLSQRLGPYQTGKYACPGGMVDDTDPSDVHAIQREVLEETGIHIHDLSRFKRSVVSQHLGGKSDVTQWFVLKLSKENWVKETPQDTEPHKHGPWRLYSMEDAKNLPLMVSTREVLNTL